MTAPSTGTWTLQRPLPRPRSLPRTSRRRAVVAAALLAAIAGASAVVATQRPGPGALVAGIEDALVALGLGLDQADLKGHKLASDTEILDALGLAEARTFLTFDVAAAGRRMVDLPWVQSAAIERLYPNRIQVTIVERRPLAAWQQGDKDVLVDGTGRALAQIASGSAPALPRIAGAGAPQDAARLFGLLAAHPDLGRQLAVAQRVSQRRWRLELRDGRRIELPADADAVALAILMEPRTGGRLFDVDAAVIDLTVLRRVVVVRKGG